MERETVEAARQGDEQAWRALFDEYYPRLFAFLRTRVADPETAEDLAAETFADAVRGLPRFRWRNRPFGAWLFAIARNRLKMHYRAQRPESAALPELPSSEHPELALEIAESFACLPAEYREAIELRYVLGLSGVEAAAVMGRSHGSFRTLLHRASRAFRDEFGGDGADAS